MKTFGFLNPTTNQFIIIESEEQFIQIKAYLDSLEKNHNEKKEEENFDDFDGLVQEVSRKKWHDQVEDMMLYDI